MRSEELSLSDLTLNREDIYLMMGSGDYVPDPEMVRRIEDRITEIATWCKPRFAYELFAVTDRGPQQMTVGGRTLTTGGVITPYLREAEYLAVFVATAGTEFEQWLRAESRSGDILREFVAGNIGSEIAEATGRALGVALEEECRQQNWQIGNPYSPGYCGWKLTDQCEIFALLPENPCGITLSDSCLMTPIKSVSGIIPVGRNVERKPYGCAICNKRDCYKKNKTR